MMASGHCVTLSLKMTLDEVNECDGDVTSTTLTDEDGHVSQYSAE